MKIVSCCDIGLVRSSNQDAYNTGSFSEDVAWAVVCDGMGGANGGNVASQTAVEKIENHINASYRKNMPERSIKNMLTCAIYNANLAIYEMAREKVELSGMGTTVVLALVADGEVHVAHAGDSRVYLIHQNAIEQLTTDHSVVQEMVDSGQLTEEEARRHPRKNIITRALGVMEEINIDYNQCPMKPGDLLLLCTDGLTNLVDDQTILQLAQTEEFSKLADALAARAKEQGGNDNITVVIIGY